MPYISRCNIACGGHAGNTETMLLTLKNAQQHQIKAGAHPGYADPDNFGRVSLKQDIQLTIDSVLKQVAGLHTMASSLNHPLQHIKLHGALYNDAERSELLAESLCEALAAHYAHLTIVGLAGGEMQKATKANQLNFLAEAFIDRAYLANGQLAPRSLIGSVYSDPQTCIQQVLDMLHGKPITSLATEALPSQPIQVKAQTFCLHGDGEKALPLAKALQQNLLNSGYQLA